MIESGNTQRLLDVLLFILSLYLAYKGGYHMLTTNEQKIHDLAKQLFNELENQGYDLNQIPGMKGFEVTRYPNNTFSIHSIIGHWNIDKYE